MEIKATEIDDGICVIEGKKRFITGPEADYNIVLARDADTYDDTLGSTRGLSMYLVPKEWEGAS
ncbi:MAG: hypothetical protein HQ574_03090, partial [Chloroflexi bacterium]|nr:hypothetical protein [Chloroflexota bacterium]